jgi:hypothetical protein
MDSQPIHHASTVNLDRAYADPEIESDGFVRLPCNQRVEDLPLASTECFD